MPEPVTLAEVKSYIRIVATDEDAKITAMIPRARLWVEDHTGLALEQRNFVERRTPKYGAIQLYKGPLVAVVSTTYLLNGVSTAYTPRSFAPSSTIFPAANAGWPALNDGNEFTVTYTAGYAVGAVDARLIGAMMALIEGEYSEGYAYPPSAVEAAERCCGQLRGNVL